SSQPPTHLVNRNVVVLLPVGVIGYLRSRCQSSDAATKNCDLLHQVHSSFAVGRILSSTTHLPLLLRGSTIPPVRDCTYAQNLCGHFPVRERRYRPQIGRLWQVGEDFRWEP